MLKNTKALSLNVVGISNSRHSVFDRNGIDIDNFEEILENSEFAKRSKDDYGRDY